MSEVHSVPFPNINHETMPIAGALIDYVMKSSDDNTVQGAIFHHQASLVALAGAIGQMELRLKELEQRAS